MLFPTQEMSAPLYNDARRSVLPATVLVPVYVQQRHRFQNTDTRI